MPTPSAGSAIQYKTLAQLVQIQLDYITANIPVTLSKPLGPFITAIAYAAALVGLVLQRLVQLALLAARLSTAVGPDVDSFIGDYQLTRLPAVAASGQVTFGRFSPAPSQIIVPTGAIVQTSPSPQATVIQFQVVAPISVVTQTVLGCTTTVLKVVSNYGMSVGDAVSVSGFTFISGVATIASLPDAGTINLNGTLSGIPGVGVNVIDGTQNPSYSTTQAGYIIPVGGSSVIATVQALVAGSSGNAATGAINKLGASLPGIDTVVNGIAFTNGIDIETDNAVRTRFALYIFGLARATKFAILSAIANVQQGLLVNVTENFTTTTIAGSSGTTLKVLSTSGMSTGDNLAIGGVAQPSGGQFSIVTIVDSQTLTLNNGLPTSLAAGVIVTDISITPGGSFSVAVDDGSGALSSSVLSQVQAAVDQVRPIAVRPIVTAAAAIQISIIARVVYLKIATQNVQSLQTVIRTALLSAINTLKPGVAQDLAPNYPTIFNAASPGDSVSTAIATTPISTTTVLQVGSTAGMAVGQVVQVDALAAAGGFLPAIASVDSSVQITLATPLVQPPVVGSLVTAFSIAGSMIQDVEFLTMSTIAITTSNSGSAAIDSSHLALPAGLTGIVANQYVIVTDETVPATPVYYQAAPGTLAQVSSYTSGTGALALTNPIGTINAQGVWTPQAPPNTLNIKVVIIAGGTADVVPGALSVLRLKALAANALLVQMEGM